MAPRHRTAAALVLAALLAGCQYAGPSPAPSSAPAAPSATDALDQQARLFIGQGAVSAVVRLRWPGGEWDNAYGVRRLDTGDPAQPTDRVAVASVTKTFTAVTVLKLVDDKLIGLDDPVNTVIPGFTETLHPPGPITVRELLDQTSGIPDYIPVSLANVDFRTALAQPLTLQEALDDAGKQPWPPTGVGLFQYSDTNYIALGLLVQTLRHKPFAQVLREEVIDPLGLKHTSLDRLDLGQPDILHGYVTFRGQRLDTTDNIHYAGTSGGGLVSTMPDVDAFFAALFGGRLLSASSLAAMETGPGLSPYALGMWKGPPGCTSGSHRFEGVGMHEDALAVAVASDDGQYVASMAVVPPPLPVTSEDPSGDRERNLIESQMESTLNQTLSALCRAG